MKLTNLQKEYLLGQRFIFGVNNDNIQVLEKLISDKHIGGIILYKKNYKTYQEMVNVISRLKNANKDNPIPLFIGIDQEGGVVNRFPNEIHNLRNIYLVSKEKPELVCEYADIICDMLLNTGINLNFAPVVDIYNNSKSKALVNRCFYGDMDSVSKLALKYIGEYNKKGIVSVIKHFPGHGATKYDSHVFLPYVADYKSILENHMLPFNKLTSIAPAIMVGHIKVKNICEKLPASLDREFVVKYLREGSKYNGLIISDEISMLRHNLFYRFNCVERVLKSRNDMILIKVDNYENAEKIIDTYDLLLSKNDIYKLELEEYVKRIIDVKDKYNISDKFKTSSLDIDDINKRIDNINKLIN